MTNLEQRIHDLPPERFARSAHAAADLAIRAAKLAGKEPPASALLIKKQSNEELSAQRKQRLDNEAADRAQTVQHADLFSAADGDAAPQSYVTEVLDGILYKSPGFLVQNFGGPVVPGGEAGDRLIVGVPKDLLSGYMKRWEKHADGSVSAVPIDSEQEVEAGETVQRTPSAERQRR